MDEYEKYLFDLNGYLVLEDVLIPEEVAACNEAIDHNPAGVTKRPDHRFRSGGSEALKGEVRRDLTGMLAWPKPWCLPFRTLLSHPRIMGCMRELLGDGFRLDSLMGILMSKGTEGFTLHGGGTKRNSFVHFYGFVNGRMRGGLTVASWALTDSCPGDGGFACIPGSHKANYPLPRDVARLERDLGVVRHVPVKAGSVIIFTEALTHGTLPWKADHERRAALFRYTPGPIAQNHPEAYRRSDVTADTRNYRPNGVDEMLEEFTPTQQALLEPPYHPGRPKIPAGCGACAT
jgi:hypothetical protein